MLYRKKPVVVEATQWFKNGDHPEDRKEQYDPIANKTYTVEFQTEHDFEGAVVKRYRSPYTPGTSICKHCGDILHNHGWIDTLEGGYSVCPGDWIITGVAGERYPCKDDIFTQTYEDV